MLIGSYKVTWLLEECLMGEKGLHILTFLCNFIPVLCVQVF